MTALKFNLNLPILCFLFLIANFPCDAVSKNVRLEVLAQLSIDTTAIQPSTGDLTLGRLNNMPSDDGRTSLDILKGVGEREIENVLEPLNRQVAIQKITFMGLDTTTKQESVGLSIGYVSKNPSLIYNDKISVRPGNLVNLVGDVGEAVSSEDLLVSESRTVLTSMSLDTTKDSKIEGFSKGFVHSKPSLHPENLQSVDEENQLINFLGNLPYTNNKVVNQSGIFELITSFALDSTNDQDQDGISSGFELNTIGLEFYRLENDGKDVDDYLGLISGYFKPQIITLEINRGADIYSNFSLDTTDDANANELSNGFEKTKTFTSNQIDTSLNLNFEDTFLYLHQVQTIPSIIKQLDRSVVALNQFQLDTTNDTDGDGLSDGFEARFASLDYNIFDSNGDGMADKIDLIGQLVSPPSHKQDRTVSLEIISSAKDHLTLSIRGEFLMNDTIEVLQTSDFLKWESVFSATTTTTAADGTDEYLFAVPTTDAKGFFRIILSY